MDVLESFKNILASNMNRCIERLTKWIRCFAVEAIMREEEISQNNILNNPVSRA